MAEHTDHTLIFLQAHEEGVPIGGVSFLGYVVYHRTMGTMRQTVFARQPEGFVLMEQTPLRCTVSYVATEEDLRRLVPEVLGEPDTREPVRLVVPERCPGREAVDYPAGIMPGAYDREALVELLRRVKGNPEAVQFVADMLEE